MSSRLSYRGSETALPRLLKLWQGGRPEAGSEGGKRPSRVDRQVSNEAMPGVSRSPLSRPSLRVLICGFAGAAPRGPERSVASTVPQEARAIARA